jgi:hypothetical protein
VGSQSGSLFPIVPDPNVAGADIEGNTPMPEFPDVSHQNFDAFLHQQLHRRTGILRPHTIVPRLTALSHHVAAAKDFRLVFREPSSPAEDSPAKQL